MTVRNLDILFKPRSVAVIGASRRAQSVGATVLHNMLHGGYTGMIYPVNPKYDRLAEQKNYRNLAALPEAPDLAVICTPPATIPGLIAELGRRGTRSAVVLTTGLARDKDGPERALQAAMLAAAKPHLLRILGPNSVGMLVPGIGLNASFAHTNALPGKLAFLSQSGALTTAMLDWARTKGIGFSHFVSLGDLADIDFGDMLDYLANDAGTSAILLYIESIRDARKFMSAARAASRNKPVVVVKSGRGPETAHAVASHTGALTASDDVYDAAFRRAGMLRANTLEELFSAAEMLARLKPLAGEGLGIMANGGGPGLLATDALVLGGGRLAAFEASTLARIDTLLPASLARANPVDIGGDASVARFSGVLEALSQDPNTGAVLLIHAPSALLDSDALAQTLAPIIRNARRNVFTNWLGGEAAETARRISREAGALTFDTPERAVQAFQAAVDYRRNQQMLMEVPPSVAQSFVPDTAAVRKLVEQALFEGREALGEPEAMAVLAAYDIPVVEARVAQTPEQVAELAQAIGFPVALKLISPDLTHKSDVGGVVLDIRSQAQASTAARQIVERVRLHRPGVRVAGFSVQRMAASDSSFELIMGMATDPVFGPVILFGQGGVAVEAIGDRAIGLPPLNLTLARELVSRARISKLLAGYRHWPAADHEAIYLTLVKLSQLVCDVPEIAELDINPLRADAHGVLALDARIVVRQAPAPGQARLAIRPYPKQLESRLESNGQIIVFRPIRPEDTQAYNDLFSSMTAEDVHFRYFGLIRSLSRSQLARTTQIDYDRAMSFVAMTPGDTPGTERMLGIAQAIVDPDNFCAEYAITVRSDLQGKGLGRILTTKMIDYCRQRGTAEMVVYILADNRRMLTLARHLGFGEAESEGDGVLRLTLRLQR
ncbi:MAG: bifunctional acetate--CoA ligase family protein/GNAT family N-acetyltransferase [Burkholderiales bacterium]|nr:GNAT family N-acetyltransferase [Burkholderiales bacterium]MDE2288974.1 bifunctional acetate--CoA ligase family protein/GNAT family N-acetyltransferase [Burkholderiales bacterium]